MSDPATRLNAALEGRYRIERQLGEGGMATVYLADDLRHERKVALKVLKPELAAVVGAERFLAEIKTTANLQHPHILPLFDSGEADGFLFYVMPYVEGETLRERLDRERQLQVDDAVSIAKAVAQALQHAHDRGVIHRDIKPGNILIQDGQPVVSDFGIALAVGSAGGARLTETGLSVGTPYYMSPEQATGDVVVGPASDLYALACVLYEMLTGDPPYIGSTAQAVLGKIIQGTPVSATGVRKAVPANVDAAIRKALEKLPADRFKGAGDFARALADPSFRHGEEVVLAAAGADAGAGPWKALAAVFGAVALVSTGVAMWALSRPVPSLPVSRQVISGGPAAPLLASNTQADVAITPDGETIVYQSLLAPFQVAMRSLDELESITLQGPEQVIGPFVSPDGAWLGFMAGGGGPIQRVSILGGPPQTIAQPAGDLRGASWGPDDIIVYGTANGGGLWQVPAGGGEPRRLTETDRGLHWFPDVLPNGAGVLFAGAATASIAPEQISVLDRRTGEHRVIIPSGTHPRYASSGHIVYAVGGTLMAVGFDSERLEVTSDPVPVVEGVMVKGSGAASFSLSATGSLVYASGDAVGGVRRTAVWVDRDGTEERLPLPPRTYQNPRLSPDGTRLAVSVTESDGSLALWVYDVVSAAGLRLTQGGVAFTPIWTLDGRLAFTTQPEGGAFQIHAVRADGSAPPELLLSNDIPVGGAQGDFPTSVTPDGRYLIFSRVLTDPHREILQVPLQGDPEPQPLLQGEFNRGNAEVSPDGGWLVYRSNQSGQMEVYVQPYPGPGPTIPVSIGGGTSVTWSPDGSELIYRLDDRMMAVSFTVEGGTPRIGQPRELFRGDYFLTNPGGPRGYHIGPDGRFLMLQDVTGPSEEVQVVLVQNFFDELKRQVPVD